MAESITYNIKNTKDNSPVISLDQQSRDILDQKSIQRFEDLGDSLINGVLSGVDEGTKRIFEHAEKISGEALGNVKAAHAFKIGFITFSIDYAMYLPNKDEASPFCIKSALN